MSGSLRELEWLESKRDGKVVQRVIKHRTHDEFDLSGHPRPVWPQPVSPRRLVSGRHRAPLVMLTGAWFDSTRKRSRVRLSRRSVAAHNRLGGPHRPAARLLRPGPGRTVRNGTGNHRPAFATSGRVRRLASAGPRSRRPRRSTAAATRLPESAESRRPQRLLEVRQRRRRERGQHQVSRPAQQQSRSRTDPAVGQ